jgi:ABC-type dipeptide/oligopeptide/nickel transport system ATPase component
MEDSPLLRIEDLRLTLAPNRFPGRPIEVFRGLSMEIPRGVSVAVLGMTGSGKSLLCNSVTRLFHHLPVREVKGAIWFENRNLLETSQSKLIQIRGSRIGNIIQNAHEHFHPRLTIAQHFHLLLRHKHQKLTGWTDHAMHYLYRVGIVDPDELLLERVFPGELEVMMRQRIMIAMALACEPDLLVADEPTAEFDSHSVARVADALESLKRERGLSILFATGRVRRAEQFGDRVAILDQGIISECAAPRDLFREGKNEITGAFLDGTVVAGKPKERLLGHRKFPGEG